MSQTRNSSPGEQPPASLPQTPAAPADAGLFEQACSSVGFSDADIAALRELATVAAQPLRRAAVQFQQELVAACRTPADRAGQSRANSAPADDSGTDWLVQVLAAPYEEPVREAARRIRLAAADAGLSGPAVLAAPARLQLLLKDIARTVFARAVRKQRHCHDAISRLTAIFSAMLAEGGLTAARSPRPLGGACLPLGAEAVYQQTLAKALLDSAPLGILAYDLYGRVTVCNARVHEILGYDLQTGTQLRQWLTQAIDDPQDRQEAELHFAASFSSELDESASETKLRVRRPDGGERVVSLSSAAVRAVSGKSLGGITVIMDVTRQQQLEQNLFRAERLAAIGELAASLAHEIKNPLAGISGAMDIIKDRFSPEDPHRDIIDEMQHQVKRMDSTVRDLLVYARPTPPDKMPVNLEELIDAVLTVLARERQLQPLQVIKHYPDAPVELSVDPDQLEQVFLNIVLNAAQAMMNPGQLVIRLGIEDGWCRVCFTDNGPGMPQDVARRAFEPFFTTKTRGTGLGLSICRKIVEAHGGRMELQTAPGQGTTVTVKLPV